MIAEVILTAGFVGTFWYIHKVGLPKILLELKQARVEMTAAIRQHGVNTAAAMAREGEKTPPKMNPIPLARRDVPIQVDGNRITPPQSSAEQQQVGGFPIP